MEAGQVQRILRNPAGFRMILLYGDDVGLIRERANAAVTAVVGARDDPFRVVELEPGGGDRLSEELATLSLTGGRRVVRVRDATDGLAAAAQTALAGRGEAWVVLEAPSLTSRSRLRALVERSAEVAVIGCYAEEGRSLVQTIETTLRELGVSARPEAVSWLAERLGADRMLTRRELEKLALFVGHGGAVDLDAAILCVGDLAGMSLEDALMAASSGMVAAADRALGLALAEGAAPVAVVRSALLHMQRLQRGRLAMESGVSASDAVRGMRPPVFFRRISAVTASLELWPTAALAIACDALWEAELACKRTGQPAELICRHAVLAVARRAALARRR